VWAQQLFFAVSINNRKGMTPQHEILNKKSKKRQLTKSAENFTFGHMSGTRAMTESTEFGIDSFPRFLQNAFK
jgi:hypothetical protein